jgi:type I restriction enzyme S subunit
MFYESRGSIMSGLNSRIVKSLFIPLPPKEEQLFIINYIESQIQKINRFIEKKKQLIALLQEQKAAIINDAVTKGLDKTVATKDSGIEWLGEIPEGWEVRKTKNLFNLITDFAPKNNKEELLSLYTEIGVKPRKELVAKGNRATTTDGYWVVKKGDIIINKLLAWMGASGISNYNGVTSPAYDILRTKGKALPNFYHYVFRNAKTFNEFKKHSRGIMEVRLRLYFSQLGSIYMPVPPKTEQSQIVAYIETTTQKIDRTIATIAKELDLVAEYKTALIAEAVTGKICLVKK